MILLLVFVVVFFLLKMNVFSVTKYLTKTWDGEESETLASDFLLYILELSVSASCHCHSCYLRCVGRYNGPCYLYSLSLFIWPVLSLVLSAKLPRSAWWWLLKRSGRREGCGGLWGGGLRSWLEHHVAQEMAALCSLAFIRSAAMLEDLRSGSTLRS